MAYDPLYKKSEGFAQRLWMHVQPPKTRDHYYRGIVKRQRVTPALISRLGLTGMLEGHSGCVNCLEWSSCGDLLASGSDDHQAIVWNPHIGRRLCSIATGHTGNIFSVNFMPHSGNSILVSGAADSLIVVNDVANAQPRRSFSCHSQRVKRLATSTDSPCLFWSASEDGTVRQFDLRDPSEAEAGRNVLVDLNRLIGPGAEAKCVRVSPSRSEQLAVGANDHCARVFDRRRLCLSRASSPSETAAGQTNCAAMTTPLNPLSDKAVQYYIPGHLPRDSSQRRGYTITYLAYSDNGRDLLVNLGNEHVYQVDAWLPTRPYRYVRPTVATATPEAMSRDAEQLKRAANDKFGRGDFAGSLRLYSRALALCPRSPALLCNRAAALLKRNWDGDSYAAMLDCTAALALQPNYQKAYYRLCKCLTQLGRSQEALECFEEFKRRWPEAANGRQEAMTGGSDRQQQQSQQQQSNGSPPSDELSRRASAADCVARYVGHCNVTTDIKEVAFFGDGHVLAGSDDGNFFVWERLTGNLVRVMEADSSIVNCLQPHPSISLLATSGIDSVVRMWAPLSDQSKNPHEVERTAECVLRNQKMMRADPLQLMLRNMGYQLGEEDENGEGQACRQS